ncbi:hypothetical protein [Actinophytocola sp.]|uniref:MmyB family transcriptional regulator n=1 Tax=Actinophytocola sp. TaxID=1872138 RepID=UPI002ED106D2
MGAIPVQGDATNAADLDRLYDTVRAAGHQIDVVVAPEVGAVDVTFDVFELPGEPGLSIATHSVEEGSPSADRFALLASWAATPPKSITSPERPA